MIRFLFRYFEYSVLKDGHIISRDTISEKSGDEVLRASRFYDFAE